MSADGTLNPEDVLRLALEDIARQKNAREAADARPTLPLVEVEPGLYTTSDPGDARPARAPHVVKCQAHGGHHESAAHDWLMSDGTVRTMTTAEAAAIGTRVCPECGHLWHDSYCEVPKSPSAIAAFPYTCSCLAHEDRESVGSADAALVAPREQNVNQTTRHGGNCGTTPFYLHHGQRAPEYDQGDAVIVWYDDLYNLAESAALIAGLRQERDDLKALWEDVGQHIDKAAIGYNHPQILGVFLMNRAFTEERRGLLDRAERAEAEVAGLLQDLQDVKAANATLIATVDLANQQRDKQTDKAEGVLTGLRALIAQKIKLWTRQCDSPGIVTPLGTRAATILEELRELEALLAPGRPARS